MFCPHCHHRGVLSSWTCYRLPCFLSFAKLQKYIRPLFDQINTASQQYITKQVMTLGLAEAEATSPSTLHISIEAQKIRNYVLEQIQSVYRGISWLLSHWTINIVVLIMGYYLAGKTRCPQLLEKDLSSLKNQELVRYAIKGSLVYCLGWIIVISIHEYYHNDYMRIIKANNRSGYKHITLLSLKLIVFFAVALIMPANHYSNRLLAALTLYIWLSQEYVRKACRFNWHSVFLKKMQFVCNFSMNQATSLVFIIAPLAAVLVPELPWLPGFVTLFPILCRFTQCFVVGTGQQFLNSIKFTLNLIGFGYSVVEMPMHSHYWRIAAAIYSFYWDVFRDWKWKIRFVEKKRFRIDLPLLWFIVGGLYDIIGRTIWILKPMGAQDRGLIEMTRRLAWNLLRLEREQVFYFKKPERNRVKNLNNSTIDIEKLVSEN